MSETEEKLLFHDHLLYPRPPSQTREWYVKWVDTYEEDLNAIQYNGPQLVVNHFLKMDLPKNSKILDIAAGTGIVGCLLQKNGFTDIDALDATQEMLCVAEKRNCYKKLIQSFVLKDTALPIEDQSYDAIIMSGCLCPGHINYEAFPQIIRICKKGGLICWSMALPEEYEERDPLFSDNNFDKYITSVCHRNKWQHISGYPKRVEGYSRGNDGWVYAMKVL